MSHWWQNTASHDYSLLVGGIDQVDRVPLDMAPISWEESVDGTGTLDFVVEDPTLAVGWSDGAQVQLVDEVNDRYLWGGLLVGRETMPMPGGGRWTRCEAVSYDWFYLDNKMKVRFASKRNRNGRNYRIRSDRAILRRLAPKGLLTPSSTVDLTNSDMDLFRVAGKTVREALEQLADAARTPSSSGRRRFYVDAQRRLHWFIAPEQFEAAPFRIADGSYIRDVIGTAGLVEYWSLREEGGTTSYGSEGVANVTQNGGWTQGVTSVGVVNEPHYRAVTLDGSSDYGTASGATLTPGDTFSLELWFKRTGANGAEVLIDATTASDYRLEFTASDELQLLKIGGASSFTSTPTYTDTSWHHLVMAHDATSTLCYVDGASVAGSGTNQTFVDGDGAIGIGGESDGTNTFTGSLQHVAIYSAKLAAATALAHYNQGISIAPDDFQHASDDRETKHRVYVRGKNRRGSGWVGPIQGNYFKGLGDTQAIINVPRATNRGKRLRYGRSFLRRNQRTTSGSFSTREEGWRAGQLLTITDAALGLSADTFEIASISGSLEAGDGPVYTIEYGALPRSMVRELKRRRSSYDR